MWAAVVGLPLATITWWAFAVRRYLRLPHAFAVATATTLIAWLLVALLIDAIVDPGVPSEWLDPMSWPRLLSVASMNPP